MVVSCDNVDRSLDSVLNYPNAVVTSKTAIAVEGKDDVYKLQLLRKNTYDGTTWEYVNIRVSEYEYNKYNVGDTTSPHKAK